MQVLFMILAPNPFVSNGIAEKDHNAAQIMGARRKYPPFPRLVASKN
jgi:hypothetical protein